MNFVPQTGDGWSPPHSTPLPAVLALARTVWRGDGDLLSLLPAAAYRKPVTELGVSRRSIALFNEPQLVREILDNASGLFPKSDLMVNALEPLIGQSIFVTDGEIWRRQRTMIDPAFTHMRVTHAFGAMQGAVEDHVEKLDKAARDGEIVSLDRIMGALTADIICRTVFSITLQSDAARQLFEDFDVFERAVAQVEIMRLILDPAWTKPRQPADVEAACQRIRQLLRSWVDRHLAAGAGAFNDIASTVMAARDPDTGEGLSREQLVDQLGVFFLAGHETTASTLTWLFFILSMHRPALAKIRSEVASATGGGEIGFGHLREMSYLRAVFRETLRLYPPVTFMPRVAMEKTRVGPRKLRRGALVMISPWTMHRNSSLWDRPTVFDPDRFCPGGEHERKRDAYIPFGAGPHTCIGSGFAHAEAGLIIARLAARYDFEPVDAGAVRPAARLTTRPAREILCRVRLAADGGHHSAA